MWTSTRFFSPHSLHSLVSAMLAPGTQWSQHPIVTLPAAKAPLTCGAARAATVAAAPRASAVRRVTFVRAITAPHRLLLIDRRIHEERPAVQIFQGRRA